MNALLCVCVCVFVYKNVVNLAIAITHRRRLCRLCLPTTTVNVKRSTWKPISWHTHIELRQHTQCSFQCHLQEKNPVPPFLFSLFCFKLPDQIMCTLYNRLFRCFLASPLHPFAHMSSPLCKCRRRPGGTFSLYNINDHFCKRNHFLWPCAFHL